MDQPNKPERVATGDTNDPSLSFGFNRGVSTLVCVKLASGLAAVSQKAKQLRAELYRSGAKAIPHASRYTETGTVGTPKLDLLHQCSI
jgi:hypothetical protein